MCLSTYLPFVSIMYICIIYLYLVIVAFFVNMLVLLHYFSCEYSLTENPTDKNLSVLKTQHFCRECGQLREFTAIDMGSRHLFCASSNRHVHKERLVLVTMPLEILASSGACQDVSTLLLVF